MVRSVLGATNKKLPPSAEDVMASTTVATNTPLLVDGLLSSFMLNNDVNIIGLVADITNADASSTSYSNWSAEFGISCKSITF